MSIAAVASVGILISFLLLGGIHNIDEGFVGVYTTFGKLHNNIQGPGYNYLIPFVTRYEAVQISVQTDQVTDIPCGTSGGVMIYFDKIEVVNRLKKEYVIQTIKNYTIEYDKIWIYDKIHHEINQFCSRHTLQEVLIEKFDTLDESLMDALEVDVKKWAPGIEIISIRVTKPRIPLSIKKNYEQMESERARLLIVQENQKVKIQQTETKSRTEIIKSQSNLEITKIQLEKEISEAQNRLKLALIEDKIYLDREQSLADAEYYQQNKELITINDKLTQEFLTQEAIKGLTENLILHLGDQIPQYISKNFDKTHIQSQ